VKVYQVRSTSNMAGWATLNYDPRNNTAWYGTLHLDTRYLTSAAARGKTACHELGHIFGLDHRHTGKTCMRDGFGTMYGHPDAADYANLRRIYAKAAERALGSA
jgi:predicted Zn-dependent protease